VIVSPSHGVVPARAARATRGALAPLARGLAALGVTPNAVTALGVMLVVVGAVLLAQERPGPALVALIAGALADTLDGVVARVGGTGSKLGAFLDSTADRIADAAVFSAAVYVGSIRADVVLLWSALIALSASLLVPYMRARAESLGVVGTLGPAPREARLVLLLAGLAAWASFGLVTAFTAAVAAIALLATITLVQRATVVIRSLAQTQR
jgi:CDP-diacylglycerol--glycerol-3-phosphate 3-phosphatidyltransferase